jgi:hypothetical protein
MTERELRAALAAALLKDGGYLRKTLSHFEEPIFLPNDAVLRCPSLRGAQRKGTGVVAVYFTPGGRMLKVAAEFTDPGLSSTITYKLPREYWPK